MITARQRLLIRNSWELMRPMAIHVADLFYDRLFELDPALRPLFRGDLEEQGRKLMAMISMAVASLDRLDTLVPAVRQLGARHGAYGVRNEHYATVGTALLWTLEKGLGPAFTPEVRAAWTTTYTLLANTMMGASPKSAVAKPVA